VQVRGECPRGPRDLAEAPLAALAAAAELDEREAARRRRLDDADGEVLHQRRAVSQARREA